MSIGNFLEVLSQRILVGIILVGRLGVAADEVWPFMISDKNVTSVNPPDNNCDNFSWRHVRFKTIHNRRIVWEETRLSKSVNILY